MIKLGIIGMGNIGNMHLNNILDGKVEGVEVTAVCDTDPLKIERVKSKEKVGKGLLCYTDSEEFFKSGEFDAVLVSTPHYYHPAQSIQALESGYHVLCEKPIGVYTKEVEKLIEVSKKTNKKFGIMYNQRTNPLYKKLKSMITDGRLGEIRRSNWIITDWYRNQAYYNSSDWRATWGGEGGGVLLNQAPHQLDLWQWFCGMPSKVRGFCYFGKRRDIEVEDDVTIYAEYPNGATGVFISTTADCPGTNRLEITGSKGKVVIEDDKMKFWELTESEKDFNNNCGTQIHDSKGQFSKPSYTVSDIEVEESPESEHVALMTNWLEAIKTSSPLLARGEEGINGLTISNAAYLSTFKDSWVNLPMDRDDFMQELNKRTEKSLIKKTLI